MYKVKEISGLQSKDVMAILKGRGVEMEERLSKRNDLAKVMPGEEIHCRGVIHGAACFEPQFIAI